MKLLIVVIVVFLAAVYIYTYIKYKKRKRNGIDAVGDFRKSYLKKESESNSQDSDSASYNYYFTKYNSSVDYIDKETFLKEASSDEESKKISPKKLQF